MPIAREDEIIDRRVTPSQARPLPLSGRKSGNAQREDAGDHSGHLQSDCCRKSLVEAVEREASIGSRSLNTAIDRRLD